MKIQQWLFKILRKQSVTNGRSEGRTDNVKTVYPPQTKFAGGITKILMTNDSLMKVKVLQNAPFERMLPFEHSAILLTCIKWQLVLKINLLCFWEWPFYTGFLWDSVIVLCFVVRNFVSILVLHSSRWGRESWLICFVCLPGVSWLLCGSSSPCHGFVCSLWLWYFLIILTYYLLYNCLQKISANNNTRQRVDKICKITCWSWLTY